MTDCPNCGAQLPAGAVVCSRCGADIPVLVERGAAPRQEGPDPAVAQVQRLLASYCKVERLLGRGRLTAVYKAEEIKPPRPVAIKMLPPGLGPAAAHFMEEARKATALNHPNILPIYRVGLRAGVPFFVAMKLVEGRSLAAAIEAQGALPLSAILVALRVAAEALTYAHGRGTAHGRLHAANILLDGNGHVVICDFGIGRVLEEAMPAAPGKAGPSSPEQVAGGPPDPRSDQYALGVVALQMLTGSMLPLADPLVSSHNIGSVREGTPDALLQVVQTVLAQDPAQRYASAADMLAALKAIPFSDTDRRDGYTLLGQLARGEPVPKVPAPAPPRRFEARPSTRVSAAAGTAAPAAKPAPAPRPDQAATVVRPAIGATPSAAPTPPRVSAPTPAPAAPAPPRVSAATPAPVAPTPPRVSAATPARAAPTPPVVEPVAAAEAVLAVPAAPVAPEPPAPAAGATSSSRTVFGARARPAPQQRSRLVGVLAALVVIAGLGGAAYWWLALRPAATPIAQAPVARQAPAAAAPSRTPVVPAAADSVHPGTAPSRSPTGELSVGVSPATARILVDGKLIGRGGAADTLVKAGRRRLRISAPGYQTLDTVVVVPAGDVLDLGQISLLQSAVEETAPAPAGGTGRIRVRTVPPTAEIFVDGQSVGVGSLVDFEVPAGQHQVRITAPGFVTVELPITVDPGATVRLGQITLKSNPSQL